MPRAVSSWLSGPEPADSGVDGSYRGKSLGLPEAGPGSLARTGRRLAALMLDWLACYGLAALLMSSGAISRPMLSTAVLVVWLAVGVISVRLFGFSPGQYALGLHVAPIDGRLHTGFGRAIGRGLLLALVIPALFMDADGRGLQDKLTFTAVVRR